MNGAPYIILPTPPIQFQIVVISSSSRQKGNERRCSARYLFVQVHSVGRFAISIIKTAYNTARMIIVRPFIRAVSCEHFSHHTFHHRFARLYPTDTPGLPHPTSVEVVPLLHVSATCSALVGVSKPPSTVQDDPARKFPISSFET